MPLVVPGITSSSGDKSEEWGNKLVGKSLSDESSTATVRNPPQLHLNPLFYGTIILGSTPAGSLTDSLVR